jgi:hypothetical protein
MRLIRPQFVNVASRIPHPNILLFDRDLNNEKLPFTVPQSATTISMGTDRLNSDAIILGTDFILGVVKMIVEMKVLRSIASRIDKNQPKSLKKKSDDIDISRGEKVTIAKALLQRHMENGILNIL